MIRERGNGFFFSGFPDGDEQIQEDNGFFFYDFPDNGTDLVNDDDFINDTITKLQEMETARKTARKSRRAMVRQEARAKRAQGKNEEKVYLNNFRRRGTQPACQKVRMTTSQCQAIGSLDRVGKMNLRPGCLGHFSCLPCTGAVHGCDQSQSQLVRSTDRLAETRTAPFLDLCTLLEGECDSLSVAPVFLFRERRTEYRNKCEGTHLGEGRCAFTDTHLARFHAYTHIRHDEGACTYASDFCLIVFPHTRSLHSQVCIEAQIDQHTSLLHTRSDGRLTPCVSVACRQKRALVVCAG